MRKAFLAAVFVFATLTTFAQGTKSQAPAKSVEQRATAITQSMATNLRLTPEQFKKVNEVNLSSMKQADKVLAKYKSNPKKLATEMDIISQTRLSLIKDILTPMQFAQYQQRREEKMGVPKEAQSNPAIRQESSRTQEQYNN
ncbi:hypothetical protein [Pontibacter fetidus]|uniref:DUF4168 domain-containing protein n=1 Tax=Pontibacter fetidus TaxID=2700082 RepID=A0A6B2H0P5_9BACT|nr:hypothetical protein [Pontibacter fetidus]NDK55891.1 hypothetical protein [Pontibacter fetidus]